MPKTRTRKVPGMSAPREPGDGAGPRSDNGKNIRLVFRSRAMLRAPGEVFTVSSKLYLSAIGPGPDDSAYDPETRLIYISNGDQAARFKAGEGRLGAQDRSDPAPHVGRW